MNTTEGIADSANTRSGELINGVRKLGPDKYSELKRLSLYIIYGTRNNNRSSAVITIDISNMSYVLVSPCKIGDCLTVVRHCEGSMVSAVFFPFVSGNLCNRRAAIIASIPITAKGIRKLYFRNHLDTHGDRVPPTRLHIMQ